MEVEGEPLGLYSHKELNEGELKSMCRRAGVPPQSEQLKELVKAVINTPALEIYGFYSRMSSRCSFLPAPTAEIYPRLWPIIRLYQPLLGFRLLSWRDRLRQYRCAGRQVARGKR